MAQQPFVDVPGTRRAWMGRVAGGMTGWWAGAMLGTAPGLTARAGHLGEWRQSDARWMRVEDVRRTTVRLPYREIPRRAMDRELPHWRYAEVFQVRLASGKVGLGETLLYYTWGATGDDDVRRVLGQNAAQLMWDDSLGAGLQMALFDGVARTLDVPLHALLGNRVHETTPLSWWNIDMPADDMASECVTALRDGYLSYKTKGRPWFDLWKQVETVAAAVPPEFKLDMDFNATLLDAARAIPILQEMEQYPQIDIYESPIPQGDVEGNRAIREATRVQIAMHYGSPPPAVAVREQVCDGFVIGGGASRVLQNAHLAAAVGLPFWLQLVGSDITAAWSLHFGGVCSHATWPAVNCHQLYSRRLLQEKIEVSEGRARVPEGPGLGYVLDEDVVRELEVAKPASRPEPPRLMAVSWPDGREMLVANTGQVNFMLTLAMQGRMPFFEKGVQTRVIPNDGSPEWREQWESARPDPRWR